MNSKVNLDWESPDNFVAQNRRQNLRQNPITIRSEAKELTPDLLRSEGFEAHIFVLTSGTQSVDVSTQKWVALSKQAFLNSAMSVNQHLEASTSDIWLHALPDFHVGGLSIWARAHLTRSQVIKTSEKWNPKAYVEQAEEQRATLSALVPTQIYDLVKNEHKSPNSLRAVLVGGDALSPNLYFSARALGWKLLPTFGMTEACSQIATAALDSLDPIHHPIHKADQIPALRLLPHLEARLSPRGHLEVKGSSLLSVYAISSVSGIEFSNPKNAEGWFETSDHCKLERVTLMNGQSTVILKPLGRASDTVKVGGELVDLNKLRALLEKLRSEIALNADLALTPVKNTRLNQALHLFFSAPALSLDSGPIVSSIDRLIQCYNESVLPFERILSHSQVYEIPRTELGKIKWQQLATSLEPPQRSSD